jgi:hypothetical protein
MLRVMLRLSHKAVEKQIQNDKRLDGSQRLYSTMEYAPLNAGNLRNLLGKVILTKRIFANIEENESIGR